MKLREHKTEILRALEILVIVIILVIVVIGLFNKFIKKSNDEQNNLGVIMDNSTTDEEDWVDPDTNHDGVVDILDEDLTDPDDQGEPYGYVGPDEALKTESTSRKVETTVDGHTISIGINEDNKDGRIYLNPVISDTKGKKFIITARSTGLMIGYNEDSFVTRGDKECKDIKYFYNVVSGLQYYDASYNSADDYGIFAQGAVGATNCLCELRFFDYDTLQLEYGINIKFDFDDNGKFGITSIEDAMIHGDRALEAFGYAEEARAEIEELADLEVKSYKVDFVNNVYTDYILAPNGYEEIGWANVDEDYFPMFAVTYRFKDIDNGCITIYTGVSGYFVGYRWYNLYEYEG